MNAGKLLDVVRALDSGGRQVQEVRIRVGQPVFLKMDDGEWWLDEGYELRKGNVTEVGRESRENPMSRGNQESRKNPMRWENKESRENQMSRADRGLIRELMGIFSKHSLYAYEEEISQGFLTIEGGHRVGISGKVVLESGHRGGISGNAALEGAGIRTIRDVSALNIRLAHERRGCAEGVLPWLCARGEVLSTLFLSPPGGGKTTMLRDLIRLISDGGAHGQGVAVSVVDERSEIGACVRGVPQCDLGMRTDVMDGCPKAVGMLMMIRSMAPRVVAVDEVGTREDLEALRDVMKCGCKILATVHGNSMEDLLRKPVIREMVREEMFSRYVVLSAMPKPGTVVGVYDEKLEPVSSAERGRGYDRRLLEVIK